MTAQRATIAIVLATLGLAAGVRAQQPPPTAAEEAPQPPLRGQVEGLFAAACDYRLSRDRRQQASERLVELGPQVLPILLERLGTSDPQERMGLNSIVPLFGGAAAPGLIKALEDPGTDMVARRWAAYLLAEVRDPAAVEPLLRQASTEDWHLRLYIAYALGRLGDERAGDALVTLLGDPNANVRRSAALALTQVKAPQAVPALAKALSDAHYGTRRGAAVALTTRAAEGVEALLRALDDSGGEVRFAALEALARCTDERVLPALTKALDSDDWADRGGAAAALGTRGDKAALPALQAALRREKQPYARARMTAAVQLLARK